MIDSVWESESFVGLRNFTLMAVSETLQISKTACRLSIHVNLNDHKKLVDTLECAQLQYNYTNIRYSILLKDEGASHALQWTLIGRPAPFIATIVKKLPVSRQQRSTL